MLAPSATRGDSPAERRRKSGSAIARLNPHAPIKEEVDVSDHLAELRRREAEPRTSPLREQDISPTSTQLQTSTSKRSAPRADSLERGEASDPLPRSESETRVSDVHSDEHLEADAKPYEFKRVTFNMQQFRDTLMLILSPSTKEDSPIWRNMTLAHHLFVPSIDFIMLFSRALRAQLDITSRPENRCVVQMRAVRFLKQALANNMMDVVDATWVPAFQAMLNNLSPIEKQILVNPRPQEKHSATQAVDSPLRRPAPVKTDSKKLRLTFSDVSPIDAARLITLHEQLLFRSIPHFECASLMPFMPGDRVSLRPRLLAHKDEARSVDNAPSHRIHQMVRWVATQIVASPDLKVRQVEIARWIEIAKHLRDLHNWNGAAEVLEALALPPVTRLSQSWKGVKSKHRALQKDTIDAVQGTTWRKMLEEQAPVIPTLTMLLQVIDSAQTLAEADFPRALETTAEVLGVLTRLHSHTFGWDDTTNNCGSAFADALVTILTRMNLDMYSKTLEPSDDRPAPPPSPPLSHVGSDTSMQQPTVDVRLAALMTRFTQKKASLTMEEAKNMIDQMNDANEADIAAAHTRYGQEDAKKGLFSSGQPNRLTFSRYVLFKKCDNFAPLHSYAVARDSKARTWETVTEGIRITNNTRGTLVWKIELLCTSSPMGCRVSFLPSSGTIKKKDTLALQVQLVFTQPSLVSVLAVLTCDGHGSYFLPLHCKGEPLTDPEREIPFNSVRTGEVIGSGAAGTVYKTIYNGGLVAVKRFRVDNIFDDSSSWKEWKNEVQLMSKLKHPNVMGLIGVCTVYPNLCIVMEYLSLGSLQRVLREKDTAMPWLLRLKFALDAARGMAFLHSLNIWHRDMKSDNLLVCSLNPEEETLKVTDFSISREQNTKRTVTTVTSGVGLGTPHWKPPEVIRGEPFVARSDVYSYGIVMWEIFTRELPYSDLHYGHQIESAVVEGRRPRFPTIKSGGEALQSVQKEYTKLAEYCWDKVAEKRPTFDDVVSVLFISLQELKRRLAEDASKETEESSNSASDELKTDTNTEHKVANEIKVKAGNSSLQESEDERAKQRRASLDVGGVTSLPPPLPTGSARLVMRYGVQEAKFRVAASSTFAALVAECKKKFKLAESITEVEMQDAEGYIVLASDIIGLVYPSFEKEEITLRIMP